MQEKNGSPIMIMKDGGFRPGSRILHGRMDFPHMILTKGHEEIMV